MRVHDAVGGGSCGAFFMKHSCMHCSLSVSYFLHCHTVTVYYNRIMKEVQFKIYIIRGNGLP